MPRLIIGLGTGNSTAMIPVGFGSNSPWTSVPEAVSVNVNEMARSIRLLVASNSRRAGRAQYGDRRLDLSERGSVVGEELRAVPDGFAREP
jgi:hypothetical protein